MKNSRRTFLKSTAVLATSLALPACTSIDDESSPVSISNSIVLKDRFDPWIEVIPEAIRSNARTLFKLSGERPVLAVIKNNGYGLGDVNVAKILDEVPEIAGFAAVKTEACLSVKDAGVKKPILHMGMASDKDFFELVSNNIQLSIYNKSTRKLLDDLAVKLGSSVKVHLYIDTGMSRMGIPYHKALPWIEDISSSANIDIQGTFMGFTEEPEFDKEQLRRLLEINTKATNKKIDIGKLHAASSNGIFHFPESALDLVRPGISLYGAYPSYPDKERKIAELEVAFRLNTRVVRIEKLRVGDSVSYGRNYVADKPVWIATLPIGHADGYLRKAVNGAKVLIGGKLYPVIGAVSASHTILEIGDNPEVKVGALATLIGPDHSEIHPSHLSVTTGDSVYDVLMHLSPRLPKIVV